MGGSLRFVLDGRIRELKDVDPTLTVLQWLRGIEYRCGTKEGCGEGDCGACTVVLGELYQGRVRLRAVNSCLLFLPMLDGKALFTVESLRSLSGELHPVQQALVECHGSQCGFCTPGLVMSLFALYESEDQPSRARLDDVLSGNLCRCTGYRPIVEAARRAYTIGQHTPRVQGRVELDELLRAIACEETMVLEHGGRRFLAPRTTEALVALLERHPEAHLLAGGTDVGLWVAKEHRSLETLLWVGAVEEMARVTTSQTHLEIGAAATYSDLQPLVAEHYPDLGVLIRRIGSNQIRNLGTLGGNLANGSPVADMSPSLLALDASLILRRGGERRELPLGDFFLGYRKTALRPGEFLERVRLPIRSANRQYRVYKISKRFDQDISTVCGAFSVELEQDRVSQIRIAYGGMAAIPARASRCEAALVGRPWTEATVMEALPVLDAEFTPISDLRASADYRRLVARNLLRKFQLETGSTAVVGCRRLTEVSP